LNSWSTQIKEQDETLRKGESAENKTWLQKQPEKSENKSFAKKSTYVKQNRAPRTHRDWDKFDIDEELEKIDQPEQEPMSLIQEKHKSAIEKKMSGNEFLKKGEFESSIKEYSEGMNLDPAVPELPANRGWAYFKLGRYAEAEQDYSLALTLNPTYQKVIKRRAKTRIMIGKVSSAENDLKRALKLDPKDKEAKQMLNELLNPSAKTKADSKNSSNSMEIKPIDRPNGLDLTNYKMTEIPISRDSEVAVSKPVEVKKTAPVIPKPVKIESAPKPKVQKIVENPKLVEKIESTTPLILPEPRSTMDFLSALEKTKNLPLSTVDYLLKIPDISRFLNDQLESDQAIQIITSFLHAEESTHQKSKAFLLKFAELDRLAMLLMMHDSEEDLAKVEKVQEKFCVDFEL